MNVNEMSYQELADILAEFGIAGVSQEIIAGMEQQWTDFPTEALDSLNKMTMLLSGIGMGRYDYQTWTWMPSSDMVYSFDMEAFDVESMYAILFQGIEAIGKDQLHFSNVVQDDGDDDRTVSFQMNGSHHQFKPKFSGDWYDTKILDYINQILEENGNPQRLYFTTDGYQQVIVLFCDEAWAEEFTQKTGCRLFTKSN